MHNAPKPNPADLLTPAQLKRSSIVAVVGAAIIGVTIYLPAELGRDPTGIGTLLGLTEMGEIKQQLAAEAAADALLHASGEIAPVPETPQNWTDEVTFTLAPGAYTEVKATMSEGATLTYAWATQGGRINFDLHAHNGIEDVTYEAGRGQRKGEGSFVTPFAGNHGWYWRNRDSADVTVTLRINGDYSGIVWENG